MPALSKPVWEGDGKVYGQRPTLKMLIKLSVIAAMTPVYLLLVLPTSIALHLFNRLFIRKVTHRSKPTPEDEAVTVKNQIAFADRKYDVVLLGATGFTGGLAAKYLGEAYQGGKVKWAIAGRRREALEKVRAALPNPEDADIIVVDTLKEDMLHDLVADTRCVISTCGPFALYSTNVVRYCAHYGTHYADITGEVSWVREMVDRFDVISKKTGARIVHCCGHDSIPWDMATYQIVQKFREEHPGAVLEKVEHYNRIIAQPSGGTLATVFNHIAGTDQYTASHAHDPLLTTHDQACSEHKLKYVPVMLKNARGTWNGPSVMATANSAVVRRSNALLGYGKNVVYEESQVAPEGIIGAASDLFGLLSTVAVFACPPLLSLARAYVLPKQGEGPSTRFMDRAFLHVTTYATFEGYSKPAEACMYLKTDPGYRDTARMLAESGLTLALSDQSTLPGQAGILTPAAALGDLLVARLGATGTQYL